MISSEPNISVGILEGKRVVYGTFNGPYELPNSIRLKGTFCAKCENNTLVLYDDEGIEVVKSRELYCKPIGNATFTINDVTVGKNFHWEKKEHQTFEGILRLSLVNDGSIIVINEIGIESYIKSVISSEMSAESPLEFLKAQAIVSRSWLVAMLERKKKNTQPYQTNYTEEQIIRWYDCNDHIAYDVCADDHCQRYQGVTKVISQSVKEAVNNTRGTYLVQGNEICDARFSKSCGGRTELFETCWEDSHHAYLQSISDSEVEFAPITSEAEAEKWILSSPEAFCNIADTKVLEQILPSLDQKTTDFFRWKVKYSREELEEIIRQKSGFDPGKLMEITPLQRGPSGRIHKLRITGTKRSVVIGKELEIRRWLSETHLYSSAFIVRNEGNKNNPPDNFVFYGAGWGHGVGLCQIGSAVMALKGYSAEKILRHYFNNCELKKFY